MTVDPTGPVVPLGERHAAEAANLHAAGIDTGFLSSLGRGFLKQIYKALPMCPGAFGYVFEEHGHVLGFIACTESTGGLYKQALKRRFFPMLWALKWHILSPSKVKRMWQTLLYPVEVGAGLPPAEILSIAVSEEARGKGVGKALMVAAMEEFARRDISRAKVAVGAGNEEANAFYRRCGFRLAARRTHHALPMHVYVAEIPRPGRQAAP